MIYSFGLFQFNPESGELLRGGRPVPIEPQPAKALALLVTRAGEIVSREELSAHVWGATQVDFNRGLAYCVGQIRSALGDDADNPRFVQTVPKRGFRFVAPVQSNAGAGVIAAATSSGVAETSNRAFSFTKSRVLRVALPALVIAAIGAWSVRSWTHASKPVIAVSVFDNETGDEKYDREVAAMSDTVVDRLTQLGPDRVGVIGNASVLRMPRAKRDLDAIADATQASHVILAQLQKKDAQVSLLMHLIRLEDGTHLWTRRLVHRPSSMGHRQAPSLHGLDEDAARNAEQAVRQFAIREH